MFLLKFYTDVMGVSAAVVGTMMMAARLLDAFTDVTMGQIADRSRGNKKMQWQLDGLPADVELPEGHAIAALCRI